MGGCPPDRSSGAVKCPPGYPIKVTLNLDKKKDGYDGVIWQPSDGLNYERVTNLKWCYQSVEDAEAESGRYRFRRPIK